MSIEAIAYAKSMDLDGAENAAARLLLYVIAENTFNDSFVCRLSQEQLAYEAGRVSERTVRRHLEALEEAGKIVRPRAQRRATGGHMLTDVIRIRGYKRWYLRDHGAHKRGGSPADKLSGGAANVSRARRAATGGQNDRPPPDTCCPPTAGHLLSAAYKDSRTSNPVPSCAPDARGSANVDFRSEVRKPRSAITLTPSDVSWGEWIEALRSDDAAAAERAIAAGEIVTTARWPGREGAALVSIGCAQ
jgi:DNA-binding transcriptional ArsR family regulator